MDDVYKEKYFKYKTKYLDLKGGRGSWFFSQPSTSSNKAINKDTKYILFYNDELTIQDTTNNNNTENIKPTMLIKTSDIMHTPNIFLYNINNNTITLLFGLNFIIKNKSAEDNGIVDIKYITFNGESLNVKSLKGGTSKSTKSKNCPDLTTFNDKINYIKELKSSEFKDEKESEFIKNFKNSVQSNIKNTLVESKSKVTKLDNEIKEKTKEYERAINSRKTQTELDIKDKTSKKNAIISEKKKKFDEEIRGYESQYEKDIAAITKTDTTNKATLTATYNNDIEDIGKKKCEIISEANQSISTIESSVSNKSDSILKDLTKLIKEFNTTKQITDLLPSNFNPFNRDEYVKSITKVYNALTSIEERRISYTKLTTFIKDSKYELTPDIEFKNIKQPNNFIILSNLKITKDKISFSRETTPEKLPFPSEIVPVAK